MHTLTTFFDWLLTASLRASVLTLGVWLVQGVLQRHLSPRWRYALWLPVLVVLLMPVLPESRWSAASVFTFEAPAANVPSASVVVDEMPSAMPVPIVSAAEPVPPIDWPRVRVVAWAAGASLVLLMGLISFTRTLTRARRTREAISDELATRIDEVTREVGLRQKPRLLMSARIQSPAVTGLLRPLLLLPPGFDRDFTAEEKRLILHHELMHLKRGDLPLNTLLCVLMALHWFNPLLWLAFFKVRADREAACDAQVLENATPQRRSAYGHALLKIESAFAPLRLSLGFIGILQRHASLRARIRSIAAPARTRPFVGVLASVLMAGMTFIGITRAEKPAAKIEVESGAADAPLISIEVRTLRFKEDTKWDFGGRMKQIQPEQQPSSSETNVALLSAQELSHVLFKEIKPLAEADLTSWPRMVTQDGKEVQIRSVVNQPVADGKKENGENRITYLPIGFIAKMIPKTLPDSKVSLELDLTDSKILGEKIIDGNPYPIAHSRAYHSSISLTSGLTAVQYDWEGHDYKDGQFRTYRPVLTFITVRRLEPRSGLPPDYIDVEALREAEAVNYHFKKERLSDVLRQLATEAGLSFFSLPEDSPEKDRLITYDTEASPFRVLETLCQANGLRLMHDNGIWYIRPGDDKEPIGKSYPVPVVFRERPEAMLDSLRGLIGLSKPGTPESGEALTHPKVILQNNAQSFYIVTDRMHHSFVTAFLDAASGSSAKATKDLANEKLRITATYQGSPIISRTSSRVGDILTAAGDVRMTTPKWSMSAASLELNLRTGAIKIQPPLEIEHSGKIIRCSDPAGWAEMDAEGKLRTSGASFSTTLSKK